MTRRELLQAGAVVLSSGLSSAQPASQFASVKALVFDTFGTVVDWRTSVAREIETLAKRSDSDPERPGIEFYRRRDVIDLLLPIV